MFEQFNLTRYRFSGSNPAAIQNMKSDYQSRDENYKPMIQADFNLDGFVDVLPFIPQPEDEWYQLIHLQSFSHMLATEDYYTERKDLDSYLIIYTQSGYGTLKYDWKSFSLSSGDIAWIDCQKYHYYQTEKENWEHCDLHINGRLANLLYDTFRQNSQTVIHENEPTTIYRQLCMILEAYVTPSSIRNMKTAQAIEQLAANLIETSYGIQKKAVNSNTDLQIRKAQSFLHSNFQSAINLDSIAAQANMSKYYFSRCFHQLTGFSPNEYLIRLRLDHAKALLENTDYSIQTVGEMSGFNDEAYFSRLFHKRIGISALKYRKMKQKPL